MRRDIIDENLKMFNTKRVILKIPLIFAPNTESYLTDQFKYRLMKLLGIGKTNNYWEINLYHENGKPVELINEVGVDEQILFATFSSTFYKKHRLLEMFAASYVQV